MGLVASLKSYFQPLDKQGDWQANEYLVLDMETTGLDANKDRVVSIGWVIVKNGSIKLNTARHILLDNGGIGEKTVGIHMITDEDIQQQGRKPESVVRYLRCLLKDRILVVHHAPMDMSFLKKLWCHYLGQTFSFILLDTLAVERRYKSNSQQMVKEGDFRLNECRKRYSLPEYGSHDALTDAFATAELMLAQIHHISDGKSIDPLLRLGGQRITLNP